MMTSTPGCNNCNECRANFCFEEMCCVLSCGCCCTIPVKIVPGACLKAGTILGQRLDDELFDAYDPNTDNGLQIPRGVLRYSVMTDEKGRINNEFIPFGIECGPLYTNMFYCGSFRIEDTKGDLASAIQYPNFGRLIEGFVGGQGLWVLGA